MTFLDLFAGIGGTALGLTRAGHTPIAFVEINPYCQAVLARHWPTTPIHDDVRTLHGTEYGEFDMLVASYPCQPFSQAGDQRGHTHEAHLWPEVARIIRDTRPHLVLLENVTGHLRVGFDAVLADLAESGYDATWDCVPASAVGAPHVRDRLWVVAHPHSGREPASPFHDETRRLSAFTRARWPEWTPDPATLGMDDGIPRRMDRRRLIALGNSVVPQVAQLLGERLPK